LGAREKKGKKKKKKEKKERDPSGILSLRRYNYVCLLQMSSCLQRDRQAPVYEVRLDGLPLPTYVTRTNMLIQIPSCSPPPAMVGDYYTSDADVYARRVKKKEREEKRKKKKKKRKEAAACAARHGSRRHSDKAWKMGGPTKVCSQNKSEVSRQLRQGLGGQDQKQPRQ
jgi:hypothetical protein